MGKPGCSLDRARPQIMEMHFKGFCFPKTMCSPKLIQSSHQQDYRGGRIFFNFSAFCSCTPLQCTTVVRESTLNRHVAGGFHKVNGEISEIPLQIQKSMQTHIKEKPQYFMIVSHYKHASKWHIFLHARVLVRKSLGKSILCIVDKVTQN